ncbi:MAG: DUF547 domain-containing protein [Betaproteobacteria bacterium]|nr:DUF547 domain-containing protein [Betaproteobacteria bacterium]
MNRLIALLIALLAAPAVSQSSAQGFDHSHATWDALVKKHVVLVQGGKASQLRYAEFAKDRTALKAYLDSLSAVNQAEFKAWNKPQQIAFLINAYNAFTVEKVLTRYPNLKSIRDFGSVFGNPWKDKFFKLFGQDAFLDQIEHETLRKPGVYDEPRVHFAVNCASVGCPMLREEAYVADRLELQLDQQTARFLSDRSRNRYSAGNARLEVSEIFRWFKEDWSSGYRGYDGSGAPVTSREQFFARHARLLTDNPEHQKIVAEGKAPIAHLDYDWSLNDVRK